MPEGIFFNILEKHRFEVKENESIATAINRYILEHYVFKIILEKHRAKEEKP